MSFQGADGQINLKLAVEGAWERYLQESANSGAWGDNIHLICAARALQRDILVVTSSQQGGADNCMSWIPSHAQQYEGGPFLLGHIWEKHYQSLKPQSKLIRGIPFYNLGGPRFFVPPSRHFFLHAYKKRFLFRQQMESNFF